MDGRVEWIRTVVCRALEVDDENFKRALTPEGSEMINKFFDEGPVGDQLLFYTQCTGEDEANAHEDSSMNSFNRRDYQDTAKQQSVSVYHWVGASLTIIDLYFCIA